MIGEKQMHKDFVVELIDQEALRQKIKEDQIHQEQVIRQIKIALVSGMLIIVLLLGCLVGVKAIGG